VPSSNAAATNPIVVCAKLAFLVLTVSLYCSATFASKEPGLVRLKICRGDGTFAPYCTYPESAVKLLFPTGEAIVEPDASPGKWVLSSATILKKIQIVRVSDTDRRFDVTGVIVGEELFIFDGVFSNDNSIAMNQLIRATASGPRSKAEALDLTKLYLAFSYYRLVDPDRFVAQRNEDSKRKDYLENDRSIRAVIGPSHSPQIVQKGTTYAVDFYAYDAPGKSINVSHWRIDVGPDGLEERLSAHHDQFHELYSAATSEITQGAGKVKFSPDMMGDGFTDDGARTDIQSWGSSDGPGLGRVHYYYKSHEPAEKRMQDYLHNAVTVIEARPWLDPQGKRVGTQALLIRINDREKTLFASAIFEDESSVLEISCSSVGNLLAALDGDFSDWEH